MKYFKFLMLFVFMTLLQGCPENMDGTIIGKLRINNLSNESIYFFDFVSSNEIEIEQVVYEYIKDIKIDSNHQLIYDVFEGQTTHGKKLYFFFFKETVLDNHTWEEIQQQHLYKKYSLTLDELNAMNWELIYDGN